MFSKLSMHCFLENYGEREEFLHSRFILYWNPDLSPDYRGTARGDDLSNEVLE